MKKLLLIAIILAYLFPINTKAGYMDSHVDYELIDGFYAYRIINGEQRRPSKLALLNVDGKIAYCIEPGVLSDKDSYYNSTENIMETPIHSANVKRLSLIGYYGYGYLNHNNIEYYMATQELLWRELGVSDMWWTDSSEGGNIINIESYKNEILNYVDSYEKAPEFIINDKYVVGQKVILYDHNEILNGYDLTDNSDFVKEGNSIIGVADNTINSFLLKRNEKIKSPVFYYKAGYQTIGVFEGAYDYERRYQINSTYGSITLNKLDYDTKNNTSLVKDAMIEGAVYALYDSNMNLVDQKSTNEEGIIMFDNLRYGIYYVKELAPSIGYNIDDKIYEINITDENYDVKITSYEKIIKSEVIITKYLDDEENNTCNYESDIIFRIYDMDDNIVDEKKTDEVGKASFILPYGKYVLKQITTSTDATLAEDRYIIADMDNPIYEYTIYNHKPKKEEILVEVLPNTSKSSYGFIGLLILLLSEIIYEKKHT